MIYFMSIRNILRGFVFGAGGSAARTKNDFPPFYG